MTTDQLIESIQGTVVAWGLSQEFIGIILLPIIGALHVAASWLAF